MHRISFLVAVVALFAFSATAQEDQDTLKALGIVPKSRKEAFDYIANIRATATTPGFSGLEAPAMDAHVLVNTCSNASSGAQCINYIRDRIRELYDMSEIASWADFCPPSFTDYYIKHLVIDYINTSKAVSVLRLAPADSVKMAFLTAADCSGR